MKRIVSIVLTLALLTGCGGGPASDVTIIQPEGEEVVDLFPAQRTDGPEAAYAAFALDLLRAGRAEGENTLLSPLSVTLALGMTSAGAAGETAEQFAHLFGVDRGELSSYCLAMMEDYGNLGGSTETNLVNSLWCDPDLALNDSFILACQNYFGAELFHADLQSPATVVAVNDWVDEATRGKIPDVIDSFDDQAVLALINAVYLKNQFAKPFITPTYEWTMDFHNADGTVAQPRSMSNGDREERYLSHEGGQGVILPYDDGKLGLLLMLPDEGVNLTEYLSAWNAGTIPALLAGRTETEVLLTVPKFQIQWSGELSDMLKALGLTDAFDPSVADFSPMGSSESGPLYIGQVIHKTAFELNEKGTEAAAVTAVVVECGGMLPMDNMIVLTFDRPFVYGIVDLDTGAPLFLGTVENLGDN